MDIDSEIIAYADAITWAESPVIDLELPTDLAELWALNNRVAAIQSAATQTRRLLKRSMGEALAGRKVVYGDTLVRYSAIPNTKIVDPDGWWSWYEATVETHQHRLLWNPNQVKAGALRGAFGDAIMDSFFHTSWSRGVTETPRHRWPKFAEQMKEGEVS